MSRPIQRTTVTVVTGGRGVHSAQTVDRLLSTLVGGLRERNSWMIRAEAPGAVKEIIVGKGVMNMNPPHGPRSFGTDHPGAALTQPSN